MLIKMRSSFRWVHTVGKASCAIVFIFPLVAIAQGTVSGSALASPFPLTSEMNRRVDDLLKSMSTEEKIGQLSQVFSFGASASTDAKIRKGDLGSILFTTDPKQINRLQHIAVDESPHHIPLLFGFDVIHGLRTIFPVPIAMAASWDPAVEEEAQRIAASEARAVGVNWTFAPMVDIARDARWGRIVEGAGEDPYLGSAMARAQVLGFQGQHLGQSDRIMATVKHFAGYGAAEGGRDYDAANVSEAQLWNVYLPPFHSAVNAGVGTVMSAYMDLNDVPATGNTWLLQDVLRKDWGFKGFVVSDADAVRSLKMHGFAKDIDDAAERAFHAGVNMEMATGATAYATGLIDAAQARRIDGLSLNEAVRPILQAKMALGLFDHPYVDESSVERVTLNPEHLEAARVAAEKSAVLLKNDADLLPLKAHSYKHIAVIGPFADAKADLLGSWALAAEPADTETIVDGLRKVGGPAVTVSTAPGVQLARKFPSPFDMLAKGPKQVNWSESQTQSEFARAIRIARDADLVIVTLGELPLMSGESASVSTLDLAGKQEQLLEAAVATGKPVLLLLINGRPLDIRWAYDHVPAILDAWFPGTEGGLAVANLLYGAARPGGKLPFTWPRDAGQLPLYYSHNKTQAPGNQAKRYWNEDGSPLFPFGFGLSYSKFHFSNLKLDRSVMVRGEKLSVTVDVENQSNVPGDEVAQLYIHQQSGSNSRPVRLLKGFQRVSLSPHEKKTLGFSLGADDLSYWATSTRTWVLDSATFDVWIGDDSNASLQSTFSTIP